MDISIWGAGDYGNRLWKIITMQVNAGFVPICYGDNNSSQEMLNNIPIYGIEVILDKYNKHEIEGVIIAVSPEKQDSILQQLTQYGIDRIFILPTYEYSNSPDKANLGNIIEVACNKPELEYLELHVCDHCNLNCKGCGHFCNLIKEPSFLNVDTYEKDLIRLSELFWNIRKIRLLGGEPLLAPELPKIIQITRKIFPLTDIRIVSNGLLITKTDNNLFKTMHNAHALFDFSLYYPTEIIKENIENLCNKYGVGYTFSEPIKMFYKGLIDRGELNIHEAWNNCESKVCTFLKDGKIALCALPFLLENINKEFGLAMSAKEDEMDLYDEGIDGWYIKRQISKPGTACKYCAVNHEEYDWCVQGYNYKKMDWFIE